MQSTSASLLVAPNFSDPEYIRITPSSAGWDHLSFAARRMRPGDTWDFDTQDYELALVVLGGTCRVASNVGSWEGVGRRPNVFAGMPYTLYLPPGTRFTVEATGEELDIAYGWALAQEAYPARLVTPAEVEIEIRGGDNVTRQINKMIPPGFPASRLVVVEVYTPSGNWSSYPPHKHDEHIVDDGGNLLEADLEEIYFYKIDQPEGFAYQRIYTPGRDIDELILARDSHLVLSPRGYHPVVAAPGYNCYYLNMLAGSAQSLAATDDPEHTWVKETWKEKDPRLPLVSMEMEKIRS
ncbi:MAG TPA: 5-deoxy-glucuronate isomerase [Anaerolineales bacterium]|nr:5-deoxy-glucuronate isomerase [Anaerolineales bacterium]